MSIPNKREDILGWIDWVLARPGHPEYRAIDFARRFSKWQRGDRVGPEPLIGDRLSGVSRRLVWSSTIAEIKAARDIFEQLIGEGVLAYRIRANGSVGRRIVRFDPTAEEVVFVTGG